MPLLYNIGMSTTIVTPHQDSREALRTASIPDTNDDGSQVPSTFWFSMLSVGLMLAITIAWFIGPSPAHSLCGLSVLLLAVLVYEFPTQASSRFITSTMNRPRHFRVAVTGMVFASTMAAQSMFSWSWLSTHGLSANSAGHLSVLFTALLITTAGRYALNYIAMTKRLFVLLACWGCSIVVDNQTLQAVAVLALSLNVVWNIHARWTPLLPEDKIHPTL